jgi:hypothetical protein
LTAAELNRAMLARQLLLERSRMSVVDAVGRVGALQAQQPASPYVALWNRVAEFSADALDAAFADRAVVKASLMRITLHAVTAADYPAFHSTMQFALRASRLNDRRFREAGLSIDETDALVPGVLEFLSDPRVKGECEAFLASQVPDRPDRVWWALRTFAALHHAPTGGPWSFGQRPSYVAAAPYDPIDDEAALAHLARRYVEAFGPASGEDLAAFTLIPRPRARAALRDLELEELEGPDGAVLFDVPGGPRPSADTPAPPRLMAMWDSVLLAHADRGRLIPPEYRPLVIRRNGDVLPTLMVDGYVAGVWRPVDDGIEVTAFNRLSRAAWSGVADEARSLLAFLADREPRVWGRRFDHWWEDLPSATVRVLGRQVRP